MESKEPVIVLENVHDTILIEDVHEFQVNLTLGLSDGNDFYLVLDFNNLSKDEYKTLIDYSNQPNRIKFSSKIIRKENYNITHIVVTKITTNNFLNLSWECLSDDPNLYNLTIE